MSSQEESTLQNETTSQDEMSSKDDNTSQDENSLQDEICLQDDKTSQDGTSSQAETISQADTSSQAETSSQDETSSQSGTNSQDETSSQSETSSQDETSSQEEISTTNFNLLDFSDEILLNIFQNFGQIDLFNASNVCTRFEEIAQDAFPKVFNGDTDKKYFAIDATTLTIYYYQPFCLTFGRKMVALRLYIRPSLIEIDNENWIFKLIEENCPSLTHLIISGRLGSPIDLMDIARLVPNLACFKMISGWYRNAKEWTSINHPHLTSFAMNNTVGFEKEDIIQLVLKNPQLNHLSVKRLNEIDVLIESLGDELNRFKYLELSSESNNYVKMDFTVDGSEVLTVSMDESTITNALLRIANGCRRLFTRLHVFRNDFDCDADDNCDFECEDNTDLDVIPLPVLNAISLFEEVELLAIKGFDLKLVEINILMQRLPKLLSLHLKMLSNDLKPDDVLFLFAEFPNLHKFTLYSYSPWEQIFGMDFYYKFFDIIRDFYGVHKIVLQSDSTNMIFTREKCIMNDELRHWVGYESNRSQSQTNFWSLNEACIKKIVEYLNQDEVHALYEASMLTKRALSDRIGAEEFQVYIDNGFSVAEEPISVFGEHIRKLAVDMRTIDPENVDSDSVMEIWDHIDTYCGETLVELKICCGQLEPLNSLDLSFPSLEVLKLIGIESNGPYVIPFDCEELKRLEIHSCKFSDIEALQPGTSFENLEILYLSDFDSGLLKMLNEDCSAVKEISLEFPKSDIRNPFWYTGNDTIYLLKRCPKLEVLNLTVDLRPMNTEGYSKYVHALRTGIDQLFPGVRMDLIERLPQCESMWTFVILSQQNCVCE